MTNTWTQKANLSFNMQRPVASVVNNKAYVGPMRVNGAYSKHLWEYDPVSDIWTQKADFSGTARELCSGFALGNKVYHGCGVDGARRDDFYEYDPNTNVWTNKANFGGGIRHSATGFSIGSLGYMGLGSFGGGAGNQSNDWWEYNVTSNAWTSKAVFNGTGNKRASAGGFGIGSVGYIVYGYYHIGTTSWPKDCYEFDPSTNIWTTKAAPINTGRSAFPSFSIGLDGYVGTGWSGSVRLRDFQKYDSVLNSWSTLSNYPAGTTMEAIGFAILDKGYITGGTRDPNGNYEWCCGIAIAIISGLVTDGVNPIQGATISAVDGTPYSTTTIASGTYSLTVDYDVYVVTASKSKYLDSSASVDASAGDQTQNFILLKPVISGNVKNSNGVNLPSVAVSLEDDTDYSTTTDSNGDYSQTVDTDTYDVIASIPGNQDQSAIVDATTSNQTQDFVFPITTAPHDKAIRLKERYLLE